jgi:hypothetical protein
MDQIEGVLKGMLDKFYAQLDRRAKDYQSQSFSGMLGLGS